MDHLLLTELTLNPHNNKDISPEAFQRTKKQIITLGQFKPLLVTKQKMIVGGHTRYQVYKEISQMQPFDIQDYIKTEINRDISEELASIIIEKAKLPKVSYLDFINKDGGVIVIIDEEEQPKVFKTIEQAVMEYGLADNDTSGHYTTDIFQAIDQFDINSVDYAINLSSLPTLQDILIKSVEMPPEKKTDNKEVTCPSCGTSFKPKKA